MNRAYKTAFFVCLFSSLLTAQDFYGGGVSARTAARAGVYVPTEDNAGDALALNPAGLAVLAGPTLNVNVSGLFARGSFTNSTNANSPMQSTRGVVPFGAFGTPLGHSRWSIGFGINPDLLSSSKWRYNDAPGVALANYGSVRENSEIIAFRSSAGVAYRLTSKLSFGASLGAIYNSNTLDAPYIFQIQPALKGLKTLLDLHTTGVGWNGSFGFLAKPTHRLEFQGAYRTRTSIVSTGGAAGNMGVQFAALGIPFQPDFSYRAQVKVVLPQSALVGAAWQATSTTRFSVQGDWTDWRDSFRNLPVQLTNGTNANINSFLQSNSIQDTVPLDWKDQFTFRGSVERALGESFSISGGFMHGNNPVPNSTLSPLTAAIMQNGISAGAGYTAGHFRLDLAYGFDFTAASRVGTSALLSGEYGNSQTQNWDSGGYVRCNVPALGTAINKESSKSVSRVLDSKSNS